MNDPNNTGTANYTLPKNNMIACNKTDSNGNRIAFSNSGTNE